MNLLSKFQYTSDTCHEIGHTWESSCALSSLHILINCIQYSLQLYTPIHLGSAIVMKGRNVSLIKVLKNILQSTLFLSTNGCFMVTFFCLLRHILGKFYYFSAGLFPGILCSFVAILIEQKSRRGLLALYMFGVACETVFNVLVNHGLAKRIKYGEVYLFVVAIAAIMYYYRANILPDGIIEKIIRILLGEKRKENSGAQGVEARSTDSTSMQVKWLRQSALIFVCGCGIHFLPSAAISVIKWILKPSFSIKNPFSWSSVRFGGFLSSFVLLFKFSEYYLNKWRGKDNKSNAFIAGGISGLSLMLNRSTALSVYLSSKAFEIFYRQISLKGYLPWFSFADVLVYTLSTGIMFHAAVLEPHSLRDAYWVFLLKLTGGKFATMNRKRLDSFGCNSSKMYPDFQPIVPLNK